MDLLDPLLATGISYFKRVVDGLGRDHDALARCKADYSKLEVDKRGDRKEIVTIVLKSCDPLVKQRLLNFLENENGLDNDIYCKRIYENLCSKLEVRFSFTVPYLSHEPTTKTLRGTLSREGFVARYASTSPRNATRPSTTINDGLVRDEKNFTSYMKSEYSSCIQRLFNSQQSASLNRPGLKTRAMLISLFESARFVRLPPRTEVLIYYAGHGQKDTGNWVVCDSTPDGQVRLSAVTLVEVLDIWTGSDVAESLCLTILADCCYSGQWVRGLKKATRYHNYPISIISACGQKEVAYEDDLVCRVMGEQPRCQDRQHPMWWATPNAIERKPFLYEELIQNIKKSQAQIVSTSQAQYGFSCTIF